MRVGQWMASRIPPVSAAELGAFRFLLGAALAWLLWDARLPTTPFPPELHSGAHPLAQWPWVHALAARPDIVAWLQHLLIGLALVFSVGLMTSLLYPTLVVGLGVWLFVRLLHTGTHDWMPLFITLAACLPVRWSDGFSLDALFRRNRPPPGPTRRASYGFALWVPGLVFGAAMLGAGTAKLVQGGPAWITNGSVKYHFIVDAANAPTNWGLWVAKHHAVAVLLSAGAIIVECSLILATLVPSWWGRLPFAVMGLGLLGGFYAFQNELWEPWWLLFLAFFVPWPALFRWLSRRRDEPAPASERRLAPLQAAAIVVVLGLQAVASTQRVEYAPLMSDYPMYSTTYASIEEFQRRNAIPAVYHFAVQFPEGDQAFASQVFDDLRLDEPVRDAYIAVVERRAPEQRTRETIQKIASRLAEHYGRPVTAIIVMIDQQGFNWETGKFGWLAIRKPVHTFAVE